MTRWALPVRGLLILALALPATSTHGRDGCLAMADTDYERIYCEVVREGQGAGLPGFEDFANNDARVQALLLRRPAERLGIELPEVPQESSPRPAQDRPQPVPTTPAPTAPDPSPRQQETSDTALSDCRLQGEVIICPGQRFELVGNKPNRALAHGVLDDDNQMDLPRFDGDRQDRSAVHRYLSRAYDAYIEKMLSIGLAGATMSFTEFYHGFFRHEEQGVDFVERMEATFHLLKQDKKTQAIQSRFHDRLPESIDACMTVGSTIVVCDNVRTNWVYQRE